MAISCLFTVSCAPALPIVYKFDPRCQSLGIIAVSSRTKLHAKRVLSEQALEQGGNTLLFGAEGIYEMRRYYARRSDVIEGHVEVGLRVPPGETGYWAAVLAC